MQVRILSGTPFAVQRQREASRISAQQGARATRRRLADIKCKAKDRPCMDCGRQYPCHVMQFDHLRDKKFVIACSVASITEQQLVAEIAKCEVVCANCHADRTYRRAYGEGAGPSLQDGTVRSVTE